MAKKISRPPKSRYSGTIANVAVERGQGLRAKWNYTVVEFTELTEVKTGERPAMSPKSAGRLAVELLMEEAEKIQPNLKAGRVMRFSAFPTRMGLQHVERISFRDVTTGPVTPVTRQRVDAPVTCVSNRGTRLEVAPVADETLEPVTDETSQPIAPVAPLVTDVTRDPVAPVTNQPCPPGDAPVTDVTTHPVTPVTTGVPTAADALDPTMDRSRELIEALIRDESKIVPTAKEVVGKWGAAMKEGAEKEKPASYVACDVCYWMSLFFEEHPEQRERFLKDSKVKKPKKGSSPFYLLVATLFADDKGNLTRAEQSYATRIGGVLRYCLERKMDQRTYMRFIRTEGGPFGVYERYVKIPRPAKDGVSPLEIDAVEKVADSRGLAVNG